MQEVNSLCTDSLALRAEYCIVDIANNTAIYFCYYFILIVDDGLIHFVLVYVVDSHVVAVGLAKRDIFVVRPIETASPVSVAC